MKRKNSVINWRLKLEWESIVRKVESESRVWKLFEKIVVIITRESKECNWLYWLLSIGWNSSIERNHDSKWMVISFMDDAPNQKYYDLMNSHSICFHPRTYQTWQNYFLTSHFHYNQFSLSLFHYTLFLHFHFTFAIYFLTLFLPTFSLHLSQVQVFTVLSLYSLNSFSGSVFSPLSYSTFSRSFLTFCLRFLS